MIFGTNDYGYRYKVIMAENRKYREQQYAARAEMDKQELFKVRPGGFLFSPLSTG